MGYYDKQISMQAMSGKGPTSSIKLNLICPRFRNNWIRDRKEAEHLRDSIKDNGLFSAITVNSIATFLKNENIPIEVKEYYEEYQKKGFEYFISSGHSRYYAYCSLCSGKTVHTYEELEKFYKDYEGYSVKDKKAQEDGEIEKRNRWLSIPAIIANDNFDSERNRYNSANLDQRAKKDFEVVYNFIDKLKDEQRYEEILDEITAQLVDKMNDRTVARVADQLKYRGKYKNIDEARELLKKTNGSLLPGFIKSHCNKLKELIYSEWHRKISLSSIQLAVNIIKMFDKEMIELIYYGDLGIRDSREILTFYELMPDKEKQELIDSIKDGTLSIKKLKKKYLSNGTDSTDSKVPYSASEWKNLFLQLISEEITLEDAEKKLKKLNVI